MLTRTRHLLLLATLLASPFADGGEIVLRSNSTPRGPVVLLGDVASLRGYALDEEKRLARMPLMPTPVAGEVQHLTARSVRDLLRAQGEPPLAHTMSGASRIVVTRKEAPTQSVSVAQSLPATVAASTHEAADRTKSEPRPGSNPRGIGFRPARAESYAGESTTNRVKLDHRASLKATLSVRKAIEAWLAAQGNAGRLLAVDKVWIEPADLSRVHEYRHSTLIAEPMANTTATPGSASFAISPAGGLPAYADVELIGLTPVVVARQPIGRGALLTAARVEVRGVKPDKLRIGKAEPFTDVASVLGRIAGTSIAEGQIITGQNSTTPLLVRRGDTVSVVYGSGGIRIRMDAIARADGRKGDLVPIEAYDTRQKFEARVIGRGELAILGGSATAAKLASNAPQGAQQ